ncbi:magnesium transporter NIPA-domain-containing protein [Schizophyllum amplum]|uniref:Magnesium transporter NIPA-domain-containing protein n=1 Tax=Schizophyllum amplum TaxID=97359 RepID=A0A550CTZ3_9AGAR|nr:magnesium transporter NIPA-domain-containing protein [Auriculariopsis ampla]
MVFLNGDNSAGAAGGDGPELDTTTVIGISVAIAGNILISLALNLQKLAHKRIERERNGKPHDEEEGSRTPQRSSNSEQPHSQHELNGVFGDAAERQPLIPFPHDADLYSATSSGQSTPHDGHHKPFRLSRFLSRRPLVQAIAPFPDRNGSHIAQIPVDVIGEDELTPHSRKDGQNGGHAPKPPSSPVADNETAYLKSKLWWTGFLLMNVGELGNFISYAWAPASVVAPLGTFALIANCFFAPLMIGERFRKRDLLGIAIAVLGAVTVVLSTQSSDTRLDPDALIHAISKTPFAAYTIIYLVLGIILVTLSPGRFGQKYVCVDVGLCALFGGFTVLSTKAVSTLLTMEWINIFTHWITYVVIAVLILTGVGQIRYLNRALMRFDSKVVIPMQFVLFNLSAIVGSAILYGDFERAKFHQIVTFLYGCGATFLGVFIIAWAGPGDGEGTEGEGEDVEDGEEEDGEDGGDGAYGEGSTPAGAIRSPRGSLGRRKRPVLIVPSGSRDLPILRRKQSIMGLSPAHVRLPRYPIHANPADRPP